MSRVERTESPGERRRSEQFREAQRARTPQPSADRKPSKAEGELGDVEEALRHQQE
jgi:hypothetical protein